MPDEPNTDPAEPKTEPDKPVPFTKTQADFDALETVVAKERQAHRDAAAKLTALEHSSASVDEQKWLDKVSAAEKSANAKLIKMAARGALSAAGLQGKPDRLIALLDLEGADVDDDGNVTGLDKPVAALKKEYPTLFGEVTQGTPQIGTLNLGNRTPGPGKKKGFAEQVADSLFVS